MASDFDETDEAFFDKLVNSDDDDDDPPVATAAASASARGLAALSLTDQPDAAPPPRDQPAVAAPPTEEPERGPSPEVDPAAVLQHPETQARAAEPVPDLAATAGADPSGDLLPEDGEALFGAAAVPGDHQGLQASPLLSLPAGTGDVSAPDRTVSQHTDSNASSQLDSSTAAEGSGDQSANVQLESTDPRYLESLYPGWKYDDATQQWYQVDTLSAQSYAAQNTGAAVAGHGSDVHLQQQQRQLGASYMQNTSHSETVLEPTQPTSQPETEADNQPAVAPLKEEEADCEPVQMHHVAHTGVGYGENNASSQFQTTSNASSQFDSSITAEGYGDQSANAQLEYNDPRYLESLYPGWKYDEATQQWYPLDTLNTQTYAAHDTGGAVTDLASGSVQQQQQSSGSYLENTSHAEPVLEPTEPTSEPKPQLEPVVAPPGTEVDNQPTVAPQKEERVEHEPMLVYTKPEAEEIPAYAGDTATAKEGVSPGSEKGIHTAIKQVQWNDFGASTGGGGADLFGDLLPDGAGDDFFGGTVPGNQGVQSSLVGAKNVSAPDHSFSTGLDNSAMISAGHNFSGGVNKNANTHFSSSGSSAGYGDQSTNAQLNSTDPKYLESLYPGWKYDEATQQWYQVGTHSAQSYIADNTGAVVALGTDNTQQNQQQFSASYLQSNLHAVLETIAEESSTNATSWPQGGTNPGPAEYPSNMLFYAEYPGWYFDTNTQQWQTLESYQQSVAQVATTVAASDVFAGAGHSVAHYTEDSYASSYNQQSQWQPNSLGNTMQPDVSGGKSLLGSSYSSNQQAGNQIGQQANAESLQSSINHEPNHIETFMPSTGQYTGSEGNQASYKGFEPFTGNQSWYRGLEHSTSKELRYKGFEPSTGFQNSRKEFQPPKDHQDGHMADEPLIRDGYVSSNGVANTQNFVPKESIYKTQMHDDSTAHTHLASNYWGTQTSSGIAQQQLIGTNDPSQHFGFSPHEQRSSAGRPPHTVVSFGFGGKLVVLKETSSMAADFDSGNQGNSGRTISVLNIPEVVADKIDHSSITNSGAFSYFHALCRHPIPGPLVGGSAASKDVNKWLDDMTGVYESSQTEFQGGDVQKVLISLLKILCQHYGKLRSPFGSDPSQEGIDGPEMAVTKLFSSCKSSANMKGYGAVVHCMRNLPSESQIQTTAQEVQNLLVSGRRKEALQHAQEGQLWGPALILALQLGHKFYADTVKKMAHCHFVSGSPLRTLCLLIAGQPADVFNFENPVNSGSLCSPHQPVEAAPKGMLDDWQENLAIITANRTKGDDLVITHLGDCLWKEKNEVASAHSCYLVAELNIDSYSESARMCLIGADHLRCPRTFTSPEAIQRTEVYEYAKVLGNSQYIHLSFQPYKLIYAYMLAEVGKISDSLKYCQASLKVLKSSGRAPELEAWKQLFMTLEDRIRTHQQGGYATNLAPGKIVGKLFTSLDKSLSRMMGTQAAPLPQLPQGVANERDVYSPPDTKVVNSQSVMSMTPLVSSASEQSMSEIGGNSGYGREVAHNRSISEPDFGKSPQHGVVSSKAQSTSGSGSSRFGWLVEKTMGLVSKSHRQAKLGEQNKFYYDEKLKRWVEEGAEIPAEEPPLPPPPSKVPFQSSVPYPNSNAPPTGGGYSSNPPEPSSGMPPMPPTQNQFSARGRIGVRSRYVDTFNKGGGGVNAFGAATSYSKPAAPSINPMSGAKFFVPTPATVASELMAEPGAHSETTRQDEPSSSPAMETAFSSPPALIPMQSTIQRYPSGDNIQRYPSGDNIPQHPSSDSIQRYPSGDNIPQHPSSDSIQWYPSGDNIPRHSSSDNIQRYPSMDNIVSPSGSVNSSMSRSRASSWSGTLPEQLSSTAATRSPDGQIMQSPSMPGKRPPHSRSSSTSSAQFNGLGEELHEVEL
ncbi:protein transport protein SEC16A homolog isoform X2 [Sorghum bicolor]|nr:protein transport protein SEC16A homolog isoform X2 [Sorghum bicolor]|eukprot:XP_021304255.1 protein transport protein SEC16A homolog isoform X2 [Sorghum bicolor]